MNITGLLPIGSVVLLHQGEKKIMIVGIGQRSASHPEKVYDYAAVPFPEGYMSADKFFLFNGDQIETVCAIGYQDGDALAFNAKAEEALQNFRKKGTAM